MQIQDRVKAKQKAHSKATPNQYLGLWICLCEIGAVGRFFFSRKINFIFGLVFINECSVCLTGFSGFRFRDSLEYLKKLKKSLDCQRRSRGVPLNLRNRRNWRIAREGAASVPSNCRNFAFKLKKSLPSN